MGDVDRRHLGRKSPPRAWEAYLLVGVFPRGSAHAWTKVHAFVGNARAGRHCLSAMEALDGAGERVVLVGHAGGVERDAAPIDDATCERAMRTWDVRSRGLEWRGFPANELAIDAPRATATSVVSDVGWWARVPRVLSYFSAFGVTTWRDARGESRGVGLVERAWGADAPVDVARLAPKRWQWDVLATDAGGAMAGLCVAGVGVRTMGRALPDETFATGRRMRVRVRDWREEEGRRVPARWEGAIATRAGELRYEARGATPVAAMVPGGGFLGTTWEGEWRGRSVGGAGFTEYRAA